MSVDDLGGREATARFDAMRRLVVAGLLTALLGGAIGWALSGFIGQSAVQAAALLQVGHVGIDNRNGTVSAPVEPVNRALERVRSRAFLDDLLRSLGLPDDAASRDPAARLLRSSFRVGIPRGSDVIEVQVVQADAAGARAALERVVERLASAHARLADPIVASIRTQREFAERELAVATAEREKLLQSADLRREAGVGNRFAESVLLGNLLKDRDEEIRELRNRRVRLEEMLTPARTYPTALLDAGGIALRDVPPDRGRGTLVGALLGGLLGAVVAARRLPGRRA